MNPVTSESFSILKLEWARKQFLSELVSDFQRCRTFDSFRSQRQIEVLLDRPREQLVILARVLPLKILSNHPTNNERLSSLSAKEQEAVEALRNDYEKDHTKHFQQHVLNIARKDHPEVKAEFNAATRNGNNLIKEIAARFNCELAGAARGEWGLIFYEQDLRITLSLKLGRNMELEYYLSISDKAFSRSLCFHDRYLGVLGIGSSEWNVETADQFPDKLVKGAEFALWHKNEYEKIISDILKQEK